METTQHHKPDTGRKDFIMATKEQERKALQQIAEIIGSLGDESCIAKAFEGCLDRARENIDNDWWISDRQELEFERRKNQNLTEQIEKKDSLITGYRHQLETISKKVLPEDIMLNCLSLIHLKQNDIYNKIQECEREILDHADEPGSEAFRKAVTKRKNLRSLQNDADRTEKAVNEAYNA